MGDGGGCFEWGYGGSGPAELARCILIDALGDRALCQTCGGGNQLVYDDETRDFRKPIDKAELRRANEMAAAEADRGDAGDRLVACFDCDGGMARVPYQEFKFDVVAHLTRAGWSMPAGNVLEWLEARSATEGRR